MSTFAKSRFRFNRWRAGSHGRRKRDALCEGEERRSHTDLAKSRRPGQEIQSSDRRSMRPRSQGTVDTTSAHQTGQAQPWPQNELCGSEEIECVWWKKRVCVNLRTACRNIHRRPRVRIDSKITLFDSLVLARLTLTSQPNAMVCLPIATNNSNASHWLSVLRCQYQSG